MLAKHHYVPKFYLSAFTEPKGRSYLWVADRKNADVRKETPRRAARISGFYDLSNVQVAQRSIIEDFLSLIESRAKAVFDRINDGDFDLTVEERYHLSNFISLQLVRVPAFKQVLSSRLTEFAKKALRRYVDDERSLRGRFGNEADFVRDYVLSDRFEVKPGADYVLASMMKLGIDSAIYIFDKNWLFITTQGAETFFTSDNPVGLLTPDASPAQGTQPMLDPRLELSISCSPSTALLVHSHDQSAWQESVSIPDVSELNRRVLPTARDYVFAPTKAQAKWVLSEWGAYRHFGPKGERGRS